MKKETAHLEKIMEDCNRKAKVFAITSGKGGVGKTNISANLALCMAASHKKVLLVDADFSLGNLDLIMNINSKYNISHMIDGGRSLEQITHVGYEGVEVICASSGMEQLADLGEFKRQRLLNELSNLSNNADTIIIDTAAGISQSVIAFCLASDHTLIVTTPEPTAMTDAYSMIKVLVKNNFKGRMSLVVNMAETLEEGKKAYQQMANVTNRFLSTHLYDAGVILKDEKLTASVKQRKPVVLAYPKAKITASIAALAGKLNKGAVVRQHEEGFFNKVVNWFF